jgi:hypothetical protein
MSPTYYHSLIGSWAAEFEYTWSVSSTATFIIEFKVWDFCATEYVPVPDGTTNSDLSYTLMDPEESLEFYSNF